MTPLAHPAPLVLAVLHPAAEIGWTSWTIHWSTVIGLAALGGGYLWWGKHLGARASAVGGRPVKPPEAGESTSPPRAASAVADARPSAELRPHRRLSFLSGLLVIFLALNGPLHDLSDYYLFSAHMVQHLLLTLLVPPLLLAGTPGWMLRPFLSHRGVGAIARWVTKPTRCFVIFNVVIAAWHLPPLYNTAMAHHPVHILQHLTFLTASVLMWWPLLSPLPELPRLAYPGQMLYCFLMVIPMSIVSIYIALADHVLYPAYAVAPRLWGITPMADQQIGGLIMWIPGGLLFYVVMSVVFFKWSARDNDTTAGAQVDWPGTARRPRQRPASSTPADVPSPTRR